MEGSNVGSKYFRDSTCEIHGDYEEVGHWFFNEKIIWSGCKMCSEERKEKEEKSRAEYEKQMEQIRIEKMLDRACIPLRFREKSFDNFIASTPEQNKALSIAKEFSEQFYVHYKDGSSLVFSGKAGTGKTHLALSIAQEVMNAGYTATYLNAMDIIRMIRDTWRKDSDKSETDVLNLLGRIDLLIIDEVGVQRGTDDEQMLLFDVINRRYSDMMPIILLTNLGTKGFSEFITERSYDRLRENGTWVSFEWGSYRKKLGENK